MVILKSNVPLILQGVESLHPTDGEVVLLLLAEHNLPDIALLMDALNEKNIAFFGGVFPGLIYGNELLSEGCIIKKFKALAPPFCVSDIAALQFTGLPNNPIATNIDHGTAVILLDGLTPNIYRFLDGLNDLLGAQCNFIGGGAGSISLIPQPCVFYNDGYTSDAAVVCIIDQQVNLGVRHGWERLAGPFVATETDGNTIVQLNWQSALEVYQNVVKEDCGVTLDTDNFASIAQGYPFGILRENEEIIVRDPLTIDGNNAIVCIGDVPQNVPLYILKGDAHSLLRAADDAINDCGHKTGFPIVANGTFVVDCITRARFLGPQFSREISIIREKISIEHDEQEPFGILSLGEISSYGETLLELFNKTIVIGTLH
jgi:hypothetical protein